MPWYKVALPFAEGGIAGKGKRLQDAFETLFMANQAGPNVALFTNHDDDYKQVFYYFSPGAEQIAQSLIKSFAAVKCEAPKKQGTAMLVGHAGALDTLLTD
jgi:hypothetical protein